MIVTFRAGMPGYSIPGISLFPVSQPICLVAREDRIRSRLPEGHGKWSGQFGQGVEYSHEK